MKPVSQALTALGITEWVLREDPTTESEFNVYFKKVTGVDNIGSSILSSNPSDFGVTWSQISTKQKELQTAYDNNAYQRSRAIEYPSMADQLDDIYHNGVDEWKKTIKAVKDKYPKE
jgi:hypothetical protein|tara:strand:- start:40 stop:390 length:351 start_codon:yes stop_codon:yes gene_type:complete